MRLFQSNSLVSRSFPQNKVIKGIVQRNLRWVKSCTRKLILLLCCGVGLYFRFFSSCHLIFRLNPFPFSTAKKRYSCSTNKQSSACGLQRLVFSSFRHNLFSAKYFVLRGNHSADKVGLTTHEAPKGETL